MLKNTGVVRKIDELGRIVVPKELRKVLNISSGDDLEIFVENDQIILKKYSVMKNFENESNKLINSVSSLVNSNLFITDKEVIITHGELKDALIPKEFKKLLLERRGYVSQNIESFLFGNIQMQGYFLIEPIIQNSDPNGLIVLFKDEKISNEDKFFIKVLKNIIENK